MKIDLNTIIKIINLIKTIIEMIQETFFKEEVKENDN